ncbi:carbohydrate ABC transporter permease [Paenibacillus thalictri]|uniref:Carbohydrate ABC transporter permease n=1 Tax=Paenibacillus thalictri TaxID=2527873 RepID=A0A4Q9DIU6_9BACL|nr:carbohydrate ABC transporter permease [Paenibacillus thalictri]TBL70744.1 carbohydrate ABC transporter permease [Paenibacillus thalictri]
MLESKTLSHRMADGVIIAVLSICSFLMLLPFIFILSGSFVSSEELLVRKFVIIPHHFSFEAYQFIFASKTIYHSLLISILITVVGTFINVLLTALMAYPLSRPTLLYRKQLMLLVVFTMLFSGGMIPTYLIVKSLGLLNTYWSLWLPTAISAFNLILLKSFFQQMPDGIEEAAKIDGCNELQTLLKIIMPLSMPAIATFSLFYAVGHWNNYFHALLYINDADKWPIQVWLRQIVILSNGGFSDSAASSEAVIPPGTIKYAIIVVATIPVMIVYPFLQKHFAKGVMLGSVKG